MKKLYTSGPDPHDSRSSFLNRVLLLGGYIIIRWYQQFIHQILTLHRTVEQMYDVD